MASILGTGGRAPHDLWIRCPSCRSLQYRKQLEDNHKVCRSCTYQLRLSPFEWAALLTNKGVLEECDAHLCSIDPLKFVAGGVDYRAKLDKAALTSGTREAFIYGTASIEGRRTVMGIHNFAFMGGTMGVAVGEKVARAFDLARAEDLPVVLVVASGGARQHEGMHALMQMAKAVAARERFRLCRRPYFSVLTDPTFGGVPASYALLADIVIAEGGARIGFAGPRVIEQATKRKLPAHVNTAEFMLEHGMVDLIVQRSTLRRTIGDLLRLCCARTYAPAVAGSPGDLWPNIVDGVRSRLHA